MPRLLIILIFLAATAIYLVRSLTQPNYEGILASTASAAQQIQHYRQVAGTHISRFEVTVLAVPSGQALGSALVECAFSWARLPPVSAMTDDSGTAVLALLSGQVELGCLLNLRVTDVAGRRAFSGAVFLDCAILLTVADLATIDVVRDPAMNLDSSVITLYSDPPAGINVPQFLDRYDVQGAETPQISGYWRGAKKLHYSVAFGGGAIRGSLPLAESGSGTLRLPDGVETLIAQVVGQGAPVMGAQVQIRIHAGNANYVSTVTTDSAGSCCHLVPWNHWDSASLHVTCDGYRPCELALGADTKAANEIRCQMNVCEAKTKASGHVVDDDGVGIPRVRVIAWRERQSSLEIRPDSMTVTDDHGWWELPIPDSDNGWMRMECSGHVTVEIPWAQSAVRVTTVMKSGCAVVVVPYGVVGNPLYSGLPIRYLLYSLDNDSYVVATCGVSILVSVCVYRTLLRQRNGRARCSIWSGTDRDRQREVLGRCGSMYRSRDVSNYRC